MNKRVNEQTDEQTSLATIVDALECRYGQNFKMSIRLFVGFHTALAH